MGYIVVITISLLFAALIVFLAVRLLINLKWVAGFVSGCTGLILLSLAAVIALGAVDFTTYHPIKPDQVVGNVSFVKQDEQVFRVTVVDAAGAERRADVNGDMWQPSIRLFDWAGVMKLAGIGPIYRFDRIRGRYFALEQERKAIRNEPVLIESRFGIDLWQAGYHNNILPPGVTASYRDATFLPMADGALFEIRLTERGLQAKPMNDPAQRAVSEWR